MDTQNGFRTYWIGKFIDCEIGRAPGKRPNRLAWKHFGGGGKQGGKRTPPYEGFFSSTGNFRSRGAATTVINGIATNLSAPLQNAGLPPFAFQVLFGSHWNGDGLCLFGLPLSVSPLPQYPPLPSELELIHHPNPPAAGPLDLRFDLGGLASAVHGNCHLHFQVAVPFCKTGKVLPDFAFFASPIFVKQS